MTAGKDERIRHHDLCFGCGPANLFGLQLELERRAEGGVAGDLSAARDDLLAVDGALAQVMGEATPPSRVA